MWWNEECLYYIVCLRKVDYEICCEILYFFLKMYVEWRLKGYILFFKVIIFEKWYYRLLFCFCWFLFCNIYIVYDFVVILNKGKLVKSKG